jgi:AbrB family looped-hinge helix DNA binding protein
LVAFENQLEVNMNRTNSNGRVGPKGQIVIPNELRNALALQPGDAITFQLEGSKLVLERRQTVIASITGKYAALSASKQEAGDHHGA